MSLIGLLTLELAPSVAKLIFQLWCKDEVADIGADLVRVVSGKTKDVIVQQKIKRQVEEIGERVTQNLIPYFEAKEGKLSEYEKNTVVYCLKDVIGSAKLNTEMLIGNDLDPAKVAEYLSALASSVTELLITNEMKVLFQLIINEVSQNVVDIASQFPNFTEKGLSELLKRENLLIQVTTDILLEVKAIREESRQDNPEEEFAVFEAEYRRAVVRKLDVIQLFGTTLSEACKRHRLSVAYITLSVEEVSFKKTINRVGDEEVESKSVGQAISGKQHFMVTGVAGSGKTTLLQWLAVNCARKSHTQPLEDLNRLIPFFVRLRQCVDGQFPSPELFPTFLASNIIGTMPPKWVHELLRQGRALVLIDGIDEIASEYRDGVREWLEDLIETFKSSYFFVTSRPHAVEGAWTKGIFSNTAELIPMDLPDIFSFVEHWHDSVKEALQEDDEKSDLELQESSLKLMLRSNRSLLKLATNPLLCSMICALNRDRQQQLPSDRIELYSACIELLLERRDVERRVIMTDYPNIGLRSKVALLEQFGYWLIRNELTMTSKDKVIQFLSAKMKDFPSFPAGIKGYNVLKLFVERTGMLREPITGQIDFTHRTFQEFFAAKAAVDNDDIGLLINNAHDDQWRDVVVLAAGRGSKRQAEDIVNGLINRGDREADMRHQLHLVAVECLSTTVELSNSIMTAVKERLKNLIPRNISEAKAIASAGDLAVPYLYNKNQLSTVAVACIRALTLIGTDSSKQALKSYAGENRITVIKEIIKAARLFEEDEFAELAGTLRVETLSFNNIDSLWPVSKITNLKNLYIYNCLRVNDLKHLEELKKLRTLTLYLAPRVRSLAPIEKLKCIERLDLHHFSSIESLSELSSITSLSKLCISCFNAVKNLDPISTFVDLEDLEIENCKSLENIDFLTNLKKLSRLKLEGLPNVSDFSPLRCHTNIRIFEFTNMPASFDIDLICGNDQLIVLSLSESNVQQLEKIQNFSGLKKLTLNTIKVSTLPNLPPSLTELVIFNSDLVDISSVNNSSSLKRITISYCDGVKDLNPLTNLKELRNVILRGPLVNELQDQIEVIKAANMGRVRFLVTD